MKKDIATLAALAFFGGQSASLGNTQVLIVRGYSYMYLHGNKIAGRTPEGEVWISLGGYPSTNTTRNRLKAVTEKLGVSLVRKGGKDLLSGKEWNGDMTRISLKTKEVAS